MADLRLILEMLSFASTVVVAIAAIYGLQQIRLLKFDMRSRSERAAKEKALEAVDQYNSSYIKLIEAFRKSLSAASLGDYEGPIGDFTRDSIPLKYRELANKRWALFDWLDAINRLDLISAMYTTGVADEKVGFDIMGRSFCRNVGYYYDVIALTRIDQACQHFDNIVRLYGTWSPRLSKAELSAAKDALESRISAIPDKRIPTIGSDMPSH